MARKLGIQHPGAMDRVMNRGDRQEAVFCDEEDLKLFVATLAGSLGTPF
ncbi:MAG: hypothetical protein ACLQU3_12335 [Limisphaerales bacterium]